MPPIVERRGKMKKTLSIALILALLVICVTAFTACTGNDELTILFEQDDDLKNTYSVIAVNPDAPFDTTNEVNINKEGADAFINWLSLKSTRELIASFGVESHGEKLFYLQEDATVKDVEIPQATSDTKEIALSTTTSVNDSGLMAFILPAFEKTYGYKVNVASAGTGAAIKAAEMGNADLILVHSKASEEAFVNAGFARKVAGFSAERISFMYNYFVLVGPKADPANVEQSANIKEAFAAIADAKLTFISRGDKSGTHNAEVKLWDKELGITNDVSALPEEIKDWYISAGQGMGACLNMAAEKQGYILSDKATFLTYKKNLAK